MCRYDGMGACCKPRCYSQLKGTATTWVCRMCSTMTMKIARGMLETRLELPAGSLKAVKDTVAQVIDQV